MQEPWEIWHILFVVFQSFALAEKKIGVRCTLKENCRKGAHEKEQGPVHITLEKFENAALNLQLAYRPH